MAAHFVGQSAEIQFDGRGRAGAWRRVVNPALAVLLRRSHRLRRTAMLDSILDTIGTIVYLGLSLVSAIVSVWPGPQGLAQPDQRLPADPR
jgi:hypothetical protein